MVVGGGYIGLEFAQMFRRFGAEVTVVEKGPRLIAPRGPGRLRGDPRNPRSRGHRRCAPAPSASASRRAGTGVAVGVDCADGAPEEIGSHVLLAMGRRPNTDDLGLEAAGVATDARGFILVDDRLATNVPGIWALGECNGRGAFTHTAYNDYEIVAANLIDGGDRKVERPPARLRALHRPAARPRRA